jgi:hypothetical protein
MRSSALRTVMVAMAAPITGCGASPEPRPTSEPTRVERARRPRAPNPPRSPGSETSPSICRTVRSAVGRSHREEGGAEKGSPQTFSPGWPSCWRQGPDRKEDQMKRSALRTALAGALVVVLAVWERHTARRAPRLQPSSARYWNRLGRLAIAQSDPVRAPTDPAIAIVAPELHEVLVEATAPIVDLFEFRTGLRGPRNGCWIDGRETG